MPAETSLEKKIILEIIMKKIEKIYGNKHNNVS